MNSKILSGLLILAIIAISCVTEFNATLPSTAADVLVVDGTIRENSTATFYLSNSFPLNFTSVPAESLNVNANLYIIDNNGYKSQPATNLGSGAYQIEVGNLDDNTEYGIQIEYNGDVYQSALSKPLRTPEIDSVSWIQPENAGNVSFRVSTHDDSGESQFFLWSYTENWEFTAYNYVTFFFNPVDTVFYNIYPAPNYYCWRSNASRNLLIGSTESLSENKIINKQLYDCYPDDSRFTVLYSATVNQQAISKAAFEYYQNKIVLNEQMGGLFTPQPSELMGNITCITDPSKKVMGYVETVKNTTQKRVFVYANQISRPPGYSTCTSITTDSINILFNSDTKDPFVQAYNSGYRPVDADPFNHPIDWSTVSCTDCTANGGSKNKPDFWPNDDK